MTGDLHQPPVPPYGQRPADVPAPEVPTIPIEAMPGLIRAAIAEVLGDPCPACGGYGSIADGPEDGQDCPVCQIFPVDLRHYGRDPVRPEEVPF